MVKNGNENDMVEVPITDKISTSDMIWVVQGKANIFRGALTKMMKIAKKLVIMFLELKLL